MTGVMLGVVLIVMVGESVQEMQLAGWLPVTTVPLSIPGWVGLWFAVFPTVEGLVAQLLAGGAGDRVLLRRRVLEGEAAAGARRRSRRWRSRPEAPPRRAAGAQRPSISVETTAS